MDPVYSLLIIFSLLLLTLVAIDVIGEIKSEKMTKLTSLKNKI